MATMTMHKRRDGSITISMKAGRGEDLRNVVEGLASKAQPKAKKPAKLPTTQG